MAGTVSATAATTIALGGLHRAANAFQVAMTRSGKTRGGGLVAIKVMREFLIQRPGLWSTEPRSRCNCEAARTFTLAVLTTYLEFGRFVETCSSRL